LGVNFITIIKIYIEQNKNKLIMKMTKKQSWIPAGVYPCENRDGNDRGRSFRFLLSWG